uniref:Uncharacterized protein n=1 Tax=Leersia perrieri TaxID=77586 RepID=A0A0D9X2D3_9ORYZ
MAACFELSVVHIAAAIQLPITVPKPIQRRQQPLHSIRAPPTSLLPAPPNRNGRFSWKWTTW